MLSAAPQAAIGMDRFEPDTLFMTVNGELETYADLLMLEVENSTPYYYRAAWQQRRGFDVTRRFGRCAVKLSPSRARDYLAASGPFSSADIGEEIRFVTRMRNCSPAKLKVDRDFLRGALAEHLIEAEFPETMRGARNESEMIAFLRSVEFDHSDANDLVSLVRLGYQCRVAAVPDLALEILETEPGSEEEEGLLDLLERRTFACDPFFRGGDLSNYFARTFVSRGLYDWSLFMAAPGT